MFKDLGDKLNKIFSKLTSVGYLTEEHINSSLREIRVSLLEADVSLEVVREFTSLVKERALGEEVIKSVTPGQMVVKIVQDTIAHILSFEEGHQINLKAKPPAVLLVMGLQGSGKTTTVAKLAKKLAKNKKILVASLDVYRPAAQKQLEVLSEKVGVESLKIIPKEDPVQITKRALSFAKDNGFDVLILDTAGRTHIDQGLMNEVVEIANISNPVEKLLVVDSMIGQESVNIAKAFNEKIGCTAIGLTRVDGDTRGGAALSMSYVAKCPIKLLGTGEGVDDLEEFDPERLASRILGMGDVVTLVEKAAEAFDEEESARLEKDLRSGQFSLEQLESQLGKIKKMGGLTKMIGMIPGMNKLSGSMNSDDLDNKAVERQIAIIRSMTRFEKRNPKLLNASRKVRISKGSGSSVQEINKLVKNFLKMQKMMKRFSSMDKKSIMRGGMDQFLQ
ncbi:MAG: signal recognition particle protein [Rickettsiales bacterium]